MEYQVPYTNRPEDITKFIDLIGSQPVPVKTLEIGMIKKWGFSPVSAGYLLEILRKMGFIDNLNRSSVIWREYKAGEKRGSLLASAIKKAYPELFEAFLCPYLEDDYGLAEFFKRTYKVSKKNSDLMTRTFQFLSEKADFQELLCDEGNKVKADQANKALPEVSSNINPRTQLTIQLHIDPQTPDEKIAVIFKNMRKYLLNKKTPE
jgi:hypothetical protein